MMSTKAEELLVSAIQAFNSYHSPDITAQLVSIDDNTALIRFRSSLPEKNVYDYFEDLRIEVENRTAVPFNILDIKHESDAFLVKFNLAYILKAKLIE